MAKPALYDPQLYRQAGIDPRAVIPRKQLVEDNKKPELKLDFKRNLRLLDEQNAINRYVWHNLPEGLNSNLIERILYYKGQGMFFYDDTLEKFYFLPYALDGTIDVYGQFMGITPVPFGNGTTEDGRKRINPFFGVTKKPYYDILLDIDRNAFMNGTVIIRDYSNQLSQTIIPRATIQESILDVEAEMLPMLRTSLINASGVKGMRVNSQDEAHNVALASEGRYQAAITGEGWIPIESGLELQELGDFKSNAQEFLLSMQAIDNFRLSQYGLQNGGLFQKQSQVLQAEEEMNDTNNNLILQDGLSNRQFAADIINSIWGLGIWVEVAECVAMNDKNMDGELFDETDSQNYNEGDVTENDIQQ